MTETLELPTEDMGGLLRQWSDVLLARVDALRKPVEPAGRTGSLLRSPASEPEVVAAERRLGRRLPPSYREFLLISDGAYGDTIGPVLVDDPDAGDSHDGWGFLPVAEVAPLAKVDPDTVEIWTEVPGDLDQANDAAGDPAPRFEGGEVREHCPMRDALLIGRGVDANCSLLVPVGNPGPGEEWEVWDHYKEGTTRWSSFRAYLYDTVEEHLGVDVDEAEALLLVAGAEAGDERSARRLGRVAPRRPPRCCSPRRGGVSRRTRSWLRWRVSVALTWSPA